MKNILLKSKHFAVLTILFMSFASQASEGLFGYIYTSETTPGGFWEYEQKQTFRSGKARGNYNAIDIRNELEYGITGNLQGALYLNSSYLNSSNQYDPEDVTQNLKDRNEFNLNGISFELLYRMLSPYKDGFGLAFYIEPEVSLRDRMTGDDAIERAVEGRLILQKNFMDDQLITASNLMLEPEWEKVDNGTVRELWVEVTFGATYHFTSNWYAGLELRNHMEFPDMNLANQEHSAYFAGPNIHYGSEKYWWTLTVLPQVAGWPRRLGVGSDGNVIDNNYAHLGQHEKIDIRFAFGIPLGEEHSHNE